MTLQEISEVTGIGVSAAKMRYYRALDAFKEAYARTESEPPSPVPVNPENL